MLHCQSVIIVRLSRLSMPAPMHQLPKYPLLLTISVSDFSGVILWRTKKAFIFGCLAAFRSVTWRGLLVGSRQDDMGTPHLCGLGRAGDSILNSHRIFRKKLP